MGTSLQADYGWFQARCMEEEEPAAVEKIPLDIPHQPQTPVINTYIVHEIPNSTAGRWDCTGHQNFTSQEDINISHFSVHYQDLHYQKCSSTIVICKPGISSIYRIRNPW